MEERYQKEKWRIIGQMYEEENIKKDARMYRKLINITKWIGLSSIPIIGILLEYLSFTLPLKDNLDLLIFGVGAMLLFIGLYHLTLAILRRK